MHLKRTVPKQNETNGDIAHDSIYIKLLNWQNYSPGESPGGGQGKGEAQEEGSGCECKRSTAGLLI